MKVTIISKEKFDKLNAVSTERAASGYTAKQEAIEAEIELGENMETDLECCFEDSPEDWASHYLAEDESLLYAPVSQRYLMTQEQVEYWQEAFAALERGEDPFN